MNPSEFRYTISVILHHPNMDPDLISSALEMDPFRKWRAGEPRMNPKGLLLGGVNKTTYWCSEGFRGKGDLDKSLESLVNRLEGKQAFLAGFCSAGGTICINIAWFTNGRLTGWTFDSDLLKRLAALQTDLGMEVFGGEDPGEKTSDAEDSERTSAP